MEQQITCKVESFWDAEAKVWVATSPDVPGLATEADTIEALSQKLREMIPELMVVDTKKHQLITIQLLPIYLIRNSHKIR